MLTVRVEKERHEGRDVERVKAVTDTNADLAKAKKALRVLGGRPSGHRPSLGSAIEERDHAQKEMETTSEKRQVAKDALTTAFDLFKRYCTNVQAVESAVQKRMRTNLRNIMQTVLGQVKESLRHIS